MRLLLKPRPMRLAPIVKQARGRTIGVGMGVALRQHLSGPTQQPERLVSGFMIENHELPEVRSVRHVDHGFPAASHFFAGEGTQMTGPTRFHDNGPEHTQRILLARRMTVECPAAFLQIRSNVPLKLPNLSCCHESFWIVAVGRFARAAHEHLGAIDNHVGRLVGNLVAERDLQAIALVRPDHKRLNQIALKTVGHRATGKGGVIAFTRCLVLLFLASNARDILGQGIHVAGIKIPEPVHGNFDIDCRNIKRTDRRAGGTAAPLRDLDLVLILSHQQDALLHRVRTGSLERAFALHLLLNLLNGPRHLVLQHRARGLMDDSHRRRVRIHHRRMLMRRHFRPRLRDAYDGSEQRDACLIRNLSTGHPFPLLNNIRRLHSIHSSSVGFTLALLKRTRVLARKIVW